MKVILLGDLHAGARNSNKVVEFWQQKFFEEVLWPYVELNGITQMIQLGDLYDNRRWLNMHTISWFEEVFADKVVDNNMTVNALIGNHDTYFKHTNTPNSPSILLEKYESNIKIWETPGSFELDDVTFTMIPWMCRENYDECKDVISQGGDICVGHFDVQGFVMHPGAISVEGLRSSDFAKWDTVWSGHYHTQSKNENIHYLGTPYQMSWSDHTTKHGFWVFDTTDRSMQFIENPFRYFHKFVWDDGCSYPDFESVNNSYVKVNVKNKSNFETFENFIDKINHNSPHELKIIESYEEFSEENVQELIKINSTEDLIKEYISDVATTASKDSVTNMMLNIYTEALVVEE